MFEALFAKENIVHLGAALYLIGFLFRNQIILRAFIIAGSPVIWFTSPTSISPPMCHSGAVSSGAQFFTLVNAVMIAGFVVDRTEFRMSSEELQLFSLLDTLSPGQFRRLIKVGRWRTATEATVLAEEDRPLDRLYYVLDGDIVIDKAGRVPLNIGPHTFIGEVAFLLPRPASATVTVTAGARYMAWDRVVLRRLQLRAPSLSVALSAALNKDMAAKIARA